MKKFNKVFLTDKGNLSNATRSIIRDYVDNHYNELELQAVYNDKNELSGYQVEFVDANGSSVYVKFELTISPMSLADKKPRTPKTPKAKEVDNTPLEEVVA